MSNILLGVNIDHVATLRQARGTRYPEPVHAALEAEQGGADSITVHLREDRRHIQERDVLMLKDTLNSRMNLEMAVTDEMVAIAERVAPDSCCFVPERREELTTEGGLNVAADERRIEAACTRLQGGGSRVSLFVDPDMGQIEAAARTGAAMIELHTGHYCNLEAPAARDEEFQRIAAAAEFAHGLGLQVNAGHGLHYHNVQAVAALPAIRELNIGHAIIARALFCGMQGAVREMKRLMVEVRRR
ncbi:MAG TPA: pyridoxine 5'-phosphate synthase [Gammaproteobacteria bacterium]|nr:pyridoxine 5'-phosphate synthase [Gammaproteobacteria bacterium]